MANIPHPEILRPDRYDPLSRRVKGQGYRDSRMTTWFLSLMVTLARGMDDCFGYPLSKKVKGQV